MRRRVVDFRRQRARLIVALSDLEADRALAQRGQPGLEFELLAILELKILSLEPCTGKEYAVRLASGELVQTGLNIAA